MSAPKRASLLGLPRELRDEIWTLAVASRPSEFTLRGYTPGALLICGAPALLHTSRQIRRETSEIFYKQTFEIRLDHGYRRFERTKDWIRVHAPAMPVERVKVMVEVGSYQMWSIGGDVLPALNGCALDSGTDFEFMPCTYSANDIKKSVMDYVEERRAAANFEFVPRAYTANDIKKRMMDYVEECRAAAK